MAVNIADNFEYNGTKPNFERDEFATIAAMKSFSDDKLPSTFIATCKEDGHIYLYNKTNTVDPVTGKWRKFTGEGGSAEVKISEKEGNTITLEKDGLYSPNLITKVPTSAPESPEDGMIWLEV